HNADISIPVDPFYAVLLYMYVIFREIRENQFFSTIELCEYYYESVPASRININRAILLKLFKFAKAGFNTQHRKPIKYCSTNTLDLHENCLHILEVTICIQSNQIFWIFRILCLL